MMTSEREHDLSGDTMLKICIAIFGEPSFQAADEYRWGSQGSKRLTVGNGQFYDYELEKGGNAITLLKLYGDGRPIHEQLDDYGCRLQPVPTVDEKPVEVDRYFYTNQDGVVMYQVRRLEYSDGRKTFRQLDAQGKPGIKGIASLPYKLHELAARPDEPVHILEGEKNVLALQAEADVVATTNSGGAKNWSDLLSIYFKGRDGVVYEDNDAAGRAHARQVISSLQGLASTIQLVTFRDFPEKFDAADFLLTHDFTELGERCQTITEQDADFSIEFDFEEDDEAGYLDDESALSYRVLSIEDLFAMPPPEWLVDTIIPKNELSVLYGPPGEGKTFIALDLSLHVAAGRDWHGQTTKPGRVLYIAGEGVSGLPSRIKAWHQHNGYEPVKDFYVLPEAVEFLDPASMFRLSNTISEMGKFDLIVIDTVARAMADGDENSATDMGKFIKSCDQLQKVHGASVLGIHHSGKDTAKGLRGSSSLKGAVNTSLSCKKVDDNQIRLTFEKQKDVEMGEPISFDMVQVQIGDGLIGQTSVALELSTIVKDEKQRFNMSTNERLAIKALRSAIFDLGHASRSGKAPGMTRVVSMDQWRAEAKALMDDGGRSFFTTFRRCVARLVEREVVGKYDDEVWLANE